MARRRSTAVFRASVQGARRPGRRLAAAGREIQRELLSRMGLRLGPALTRIFRQYAPHDSGRLERGIQVTVTSRGGRITTTLHSTARSPEGYAYTGVTRFGHRKRIIRPKPPRQFLRFPARSGGFVFARQVRGQRPAFDWAERAARAADREVERAGEEIGRRIVTRLL